MAHWLVKSEPEVWSYDQHAKKGVEAWTGVRNYQAANNMKAMKKGERAFFYHSGEEKQIVGIVEVTKEYYPDHTDESGRFGMVDFKAVKAVKAPVTLKQVKADPKLANLQLVTNSRLSVQSVDDKSWAAICKMAGIEA
jgi:predicted RNA-binding protein with PUA-like domain